jgi:predicted permease
MLPILAITLPIFLIIAIGYAATRAGLFTPEQVRGLGKLVITFALPALVFRALSQRPLTEIFDARYVAVYGLASLATLLGGVAWFRLARRRGLTESAIRGLGMAASNSGFIGYPVAVQFLGPPAAIALALVMIVENLLVLPLSLAMAEGGSSTHASLPKILRGIAINLAKSPLIIAIVAGGAFGLAGVQLPGPLARAVSMVADASAPVALFAIGGTLVGLRLTGIVGEIAQISIGKLIVHPLAVVAAMQLIPIADPNLRRAAIVFACIPMISVYPILGGRYGQEKVCAAALLAATTASFVTITVVLWLVETFLPVG